MPRNMSFALTTKQFKAKTKTVTRRLGWWFLKSGDIVQGVEKVRGLKKGERVKPLGMIRIVATRAEFLCEITSKDVCREGFPFFPPSGFVLMFCSRFNCSPKQKVNRIEFEYVEKMKE